MADRSKGKRSGKALRFAVSGALLVAPAAGCGNETAPEEPTINVPYEEPTPNVPAEPQTEPVPNPTAPDPTTMQLPLPNPTGPDPEPAVAPTPNVPVTE